ncbi:MAG: helix-turn-helix domain-containing protein [Halofilum sp. (in: g-proteobacteria)]
MSEAIAPKKPALEDWHRADIVAALRKAGWTLRRLAKHHGYGCPTTLSTALERSYPRAERLIAEAIGVSPEVIWPSRYAQRTQHTTRKNRRRPVRREPDTANAGRPAATRRVRTST